MNKSGLWIALALLALVGGGIGYLIYQDNQTPTPAAPSENKVFSGGLKDLTEMRLQRPGEAAIALRGTGDSNWNIIEPQPYAADPIMVGDLIGLLRTLEAERSLDAAGVDSADFGLQSPMFTLTVREGEQQQVLRVGGVNPTGTARYSQLEGKDTLYLLAMATVNALNKTLGELRQKRLVEASEYGAQRIRVESPLGTRELWRRDSRDWTFAQPEGFFADQRLMTEFVTQVVSLRTDAESLNGESLPEGRFLALPLYARLSVSTEAKTEAAELRGTPGDVYARSALVGGIYRVPAEIDNFLRKPLTDFRDLRVFRFGFADVFQLHYEGGGTKLELEKPNENWMLGSRKVDASAANKLVDELRGANAAEYREGNSPGAVTHTIRVQVADGREETVRLHKADEAIFATRDGEGGYYRLPEGFLKGLEAAAGAVAP